MWWIIGIILFLIINICIIILSRLYITLLYLHRDDRDFLQVELRFLRWVKIKKEVPLIAVDKEDMSIKTKEKTEVGSKDKGEQSKSYTPKDIYNQIKSIHDFLNRVIGLHKIIRRFLQKVHVESLKWDTQVGTPSASTTGTICGAIWSVKGCIVGILSQYLKLKQKPEIYVTPFFQQKHSVTRLECMISFRFGQAIFAVFQIVRYTKGKIPKWRKKTA
ncbi:DUF2953 domain-containing protein [Pontibacillus yanchengensis]|uniref:DUF2953 domain-containing protein n=1 Tax=Pontibacillus yanchengensis TaxID=462910 RepID=A0ACC7VEK0_9BACI|nr:DUF2953 domain-containing protein [Pontibacillus yanchengensis]MYL53202.1 DUF2953 domain-containing protein [Pontibacillus yanchengensis]